MLTLSSAQWFPTDPNKSFPVILSLPPVVVLAFSSSSPSMVQFAKLRSGNQIRAKSTKDTAEVYLRSLTEVLTQKRQREPGREILEKEREREREREKEKQSKLQVQFIWTFNSRAMVLCLVTHNIAS